MSIVLALDVGRKRIGLALSDPSRTIASPYKTLERAKGAAESEILRVIQELQINTIVVGLPLSEKGDKTEQCDDIERFCRRLSRRTEANIAFIDEHLTTVEASERLALSGRRESSVKGKLDAVAAAIILEDYLKSLR